MNLVTLFCFDGVDNGWLTTYDSCIPSMVAPRNIYITRRATLTITATDSPSYKLSFTSDISCLEGYYQDFKNNNNSSNNNQQPLKYVNGYKKHIHTCPRTRYAHEGDVLTPSSWQTAAASAEPHPSWQTGSQLY